MMGRAIGKPIPRDRRGLECKDAGEDIVKDVESLEPSQRLGTGESLGVTVGSG
ncbi:MAG: hypothetical protein L0271_15370 [Gemmatimonadetes bacterium]|nr:hypothetical protein [Gemmatimonadota bacterium]